MAKHLEVDPKKCVSCRTCELACSFGHHKEINPNLSRINVFYFEEDMVSVPVVCMQCDDASCLAVCPTGALSRNEEGVVVHNEQKCIKCKQCVSACPLGNISYSPKIQNVFKCDLCGGDPLCVKFCPAHALSFVDSNETPSKKAETAQKIKEASMASCEI